LGVQGSFFGFSVKAAEVASNTYPVSHLLIGEGTSKWIRIPKITRRGTYIFYNLFFGRNRENLVWVSLLFNNMESVVFSVHGKGSFREYLIRYIYRNNWFGLWS
jgi:hypothetical protein